MHWVSWFFHRYFLLLGEGGGPFMPFHKTDVLYLWLNITCHALVIGGIAWLGNLLNLTTAWAVGLAIAVHLLALLVGLWTELCDVYDQIEREKEGF